MWMSCPKARRRDFTAGIGCAGCCKVHVDYRDYFEVLGVAFVHNLSLLAPAARQIDDTNCYAYGLLIRTASLVMRLFIRLDETYCAFGLFEAASDRSAGA
jgi:hypothetical protein